MAKDRFHIPPEAYHSSRHSTHDGVGRNTPGDHGTGPDDGSTTDGHAMHNNGPRTDPDIIFDYHPQVILWPLFRISDIEHDPPHQISPMVAALDGRVTVISVWIKAKIPSMAAKQGPIHHHAQAAPNPLGQHQAVRWHSY